MKYPTIALLAVCITSCTNPPAKKAYFIPAEFLMSEKDKTEGKTYIYQNESTGEQSLYNIYYIEQKGVKYLVTCVFRDGKTIDSVLEQDDKTYENYSAFFSNTLTKGIIRQDTVINNGTRIGKRVVEVIFSYDSVSMHAKSEIEFLKDTIFTWQGKSRPTLVLQNQYTFRIVYTDSLTNKPLTYTVPTLSYHAKGIGIVRLRGYDATLKQMKNIDLIEIRSKPR